MRDVFLRLTALGDGTQDTRRRAATAELLDGADAVATAAVLDRLASARLITVAEDSVTVAHEALIQECPDCVAGWPMTGNCCWRTAV